jgi:23S rRNA pseudouridine2604 synthase
MNKDDLIDYPIRINRYLELKGVATRRGADDLIAEGLVFVNGKRAVLGYKVNKNDKVEVSPKAGIKEKVFEYFAFYKPRGIVTHSPQEDEREISDLTKRKDIFPLGRLDKESEGLIILTNDGRITDRLLNPKYEHEKEYEVEVKEKVSPMHKKILEGGIISLREMLKAKHVEITGSSTMTILLTEGKKHQIRRMLDGAHLTVKSLKRVRVMNIKLGKLRSGEWRTLAGRELKDFLSMLY